MIFKLNHVTILEKFRRVMAADDSNTWDTEQALVETLRGDFAGNDKTRIGTAFHKLVEDGRPENIIGYSTPGADNKAPGDEQQYHISRGFAFTEEQAQVAYDYKAQHPTMFCEVPVTKLYHTPIASFYLCGRIDGLEGVQVRDVKTRFSAPDAQSYLDSCQWKFYLDMMGLSTFYYDLFEVKSYPKDGIGGATLVETGHDIMDPKPEYLWFIDKLRFVQHEPISCFAYPTMRRDLNELIGAFAEWLRDRNLWHLLPPCNEDGSYKTPPAQTGSARTTQTPARSPA